MNPKPHGKRSEPRQGRKGYSLIELLVVIAAILILIAVSLTAMMGSERTSKDQAAKHNLRVAALLAEGARIDARGNYGIDTVDLLNHMSSGAENGMKIAPIASQDESQGTVLVSRDSDDQVTFCSMGHSRWYCLRGELFIGNALPASMLVNQGGGQGNGQSGNGNGQGQESIAICHATGSATNPYVLIVVATPSLVAHYENENSIIPAPSDGCPGLPPDPDDPIAIPPTPGWDDPDAESWEATEDGKPSRHEERMNLQQRSASQSLLHYSHGMSLIDALCNLPTEVEGHDCASGGDSW